MSCVCNSVGDCGCEADVTSARWPQASRPIGPRRNGVARANNSPPIMMSWPTRAAQPAHMACKRGPRNCGGLPGPPILMAGPAIRLRNFDLASAETRVPMTILRGEVGGVDMVALDGARSEQRRSVSTMAYSIRDPGAGETAEPCHGFVSGNPIAGGEIEVVVEKVCTRVPATKPLAWDTWDCPGLTRQEQEAAEDKAASEEHDANIAREIARLKSQVNCRGTCRGRGGVCAPVLGYSSWPPSDGDDRGKIPKKRKGKIEIAACKLQNLPPFNHYCTYTWTIVVPSFVVFLNCEC